METTGVEPVVPFGRRIYSPLGLPIFLHLHNGSTPDKATLWPQVPAYLWCIKHGTRYRIRTGVNAVKGHYPGPLDEPSKTI